MKGWGRKVFEGLPWNDLDYERMIIELETGETWVRYGMTDPVVEEWGKRVRLEMLKGTPYPIFGTLTQERLDAMTSYGIARLRDAFRRDPNDKEEETE